MLVVPMLWLTDEKLSAVCRGNCLCRPASRPGEKETEEPSHYPMQQRRRPDYITSESRTEDGPTRAGELLSPRRSYLDHQHNRHAGRQVHTDSDSPFTICLCLFSQLRGASCLRWSTTWLLCKRLVRSYHAVVIMAFSRCRFLMICSLAAWDEEEVG